MLKNIAIKILIFSLFSASIIYFINDYMKIKKENNRLENNFTTLQSSFDSIRGKNDELHYSMRGLILKHDEVESDLKHKLDSMKIKLKNVKNIIQTNTEYIYKVDTILVQADSINSFYTEIKDEYINVNWNSEIIKSNELLVKDFNFNLKDSLTIVSETIYSGCWFWKKPKGIKVNIKSENPYFKMNEIKYIEIE